MRVHDPLRKLPERLLLPLRILSDNRAHVGLEEERERLARDGSDDAVDLDGVLARLGASGLDVVRGGAKTATYEDR